MKQLHINSLSQIMIVGQINPNQVDTVNRTSKIMADTGHHLKYNTNKPQKQITCRAEVHKNTIKKEFEVP